MAMSMQYTKNGGSEDDPPELGKGVVKVVVIGERGVGKTTFIRAFYDHHEPGKIDSHNGVRWYPCEFSGDGEHYRAAIFEIPADPEVFAGERELHYADAKIIVFMYAVDDPLSFEQITDKWLPESRDIIREHGIPAVVVGNKNDLRNNQQVIDRLALDGQTPVEYEQGEWLLADIEIEKFTEISARNPDDVNRAFDLIFRFVWDDE